MQESRESEAQWYAVQTHPNREFMADSALAAIEGVETFLPALHVQPVNPRSRKERPFFPGYLFVCADLRALGQNCIQYKPGVTRLVGLDDEPTPIPVPIIAEAHVISGVPLTSLSDPASNKRAAPHGPCGPFLPMPRSKRGGEG